LEDFIGDIVIVAKAQLAMEECILSDRLDTVRMQDYTFMFLCDINNDLKKQLRLRYPDHGRVGRQECSAGGAGGGGGEGRVWDMVFRFPFEAGETEEFLTFWPFY
jgi:hypothetical protein